MHLCLFILSFPLQNVSTEEGREREGDATEEEVIPTCGDPESSRWGEGEGGYRVREALDELAFHGLELLLGFACFIDGST